MKTPIVDPPIQNGWQRRWLALLTDLEIANEPSQLRQQIQGCRVRQLELSAGHIAADVVRRDSASCTVVIEAAELTDEQWTAVLDALGSQAIFSAQLLAGDMPTEIEKVFAQCGATLMPAMADDLQIICGCCTSAERLCRPALAAYVAVGEMLNDDPWLLFRLRGRDRQQVLRELHARRSGLTDDGAGQAAPAGQSLIYRAGGVPAQLEETPLLDEMLDHYWGRARHQLEFQHHITAPHIELVLLRRLGPPSFADASVDVYEDLAETYRRVTNASMAVAYSPEVPDADGGE